LIQVVNFNQIDPVKWDSCVRNSLQERVYAYYDVLYFSTGKQWIGLIYEDYKAVMPIPIKYKWNIIPFVSQPQFCQQLGVFSKDVLTYSIFTEFLKILKKQSIIKVHYFFNALNTKYLEGYHQRPNYILPLQNDYQKIYTQYKSSLKKNLNKANKNNLQWKQNAPLKICFDHYQKAHGKYHNELNFDFFLKIQNKKSINFHLIGVKKDNQWLASAIFLQDSKRLYYILGAPTELGRSLGALPFLLDGLIQKFAGRNMILDFEGSQIQSVANFYEKFTLQKEYFIEFKYGIL
tara:strand:- start:436 stop:1308 length:873 start_codon:yes stop_codon:yes gene_type:complete